MGVAGGIPYEAVVLWAEENEVEDLERFDFLISAMDRQWTKYTHRK